VLDGKVQIKPFIERHPLAEINAVFDAVHRHAVKRRVVLIPHA
jgi:6-hydroxycyclohex-1-ene-1-carbonyl-CoA dehydrogenase